MNTRSSRLNQFITQFAGLLLVAGVAGAGLSILSASGCSSQRAAEPYEGPVAEAQQALSTCVTIQRGTLGAVEDAAIAPNVTTQRWAPATLRVAIQHESLIRFDMSSIPSGAVVSSATLSLYTGPFVTSGPLWARYALVPWSELTVTFASFNQQANSKVAGIMTPTSPNTVQTMSVKPAVVQGWLDGAIPNHGLLLETMITQPNVYRDTVFVSSDTPVVALRPALQVCYTTPDDHCSPNPCQSGGTCTNGFTGYTCTCAPGFTGTNCEIDIDGCAGNPCQNGGACTDEVSGYTCQCAPGFTGANCHIDVNECAPSPCQNGGICSDQVNGYTCSCPPGYSGTDCEINIDDCAGNPCQNGGACTDEVSGYTCQCAPGFTGQNCQIDIDDCIGNTCQNGSTCADGANGYTCICPPGFTGALCEINIDDCAGTPCQNSGACTDGVSGYTCQCAPGFTGQNCQVNVDDCSPNPCPNGQLCIDGVASHTCQICSDCSACADGSACNGGVCAGGVCAANGTITGTRNLSTDSLTAGRTCGEAVAYSVTALTANAATLSTAVAAGCLAPGDKVLLINEQGEASATVNVGNFEVLTVSTVSATAVGFTAGKTLFYGSAAASDAGIGTGAGQQKVVLQRLPVFGNLALAAGATLTIDAWDGLKGGVLAFRAANVTIGGTVTASGKGYRTAGYSIDNHCSYNIPTENGESITGPPAQTTAANGGGSGGISGGSGISFNNNTPLSASAGHATAGQAGKNPNGRTVGPPGAAYGAGDGSRLTMGSGSGGNITCDSGEFAPFLTPRSNGAGGIVAIFAHSVTVSPGGAVIANGLNGSRMAGSGGYVLVRANTVSLGTNLARAIGAQGVTNGFTGTFTNVASDGYVAVDYKLTFSGTTSPAANAVQKPGLVLP